LNQGVSLPTAFDGALTVNATGGFGGFTYQWNAGNGPSLTNLPIGSYTVTVSDAEGCTNTKTEVIEYDPSVLNLNLTTTNSCISPANGTLSINVNGGLGPYSLVVTGPGYNETFDNVPGGVFTIEDLPAGTYTVVATDNAPGALQQSVTKTKDVLEIIMSIDPIAIYPSTNGNSNGRIDITPSGGTLPYTYQWNNSSIAQDPNNLEEGCYQLTMGEAGGCFQVFPEICVFDFSADSSTNKPECSNDLGSITVTPSSQQNAPFTYQWTSNGQPVGTGDSTLADVPPGNYTVKITDALGVSITQTFTLTANSNLTGDVIATSNFNGFNIRCFNGTSGTATATGQNGFGNTYNYLWSNGATGPTASGLSAGIVWVTITDGIGCAVVDSVILSQPTQLTIETESGRNDCTEDGGVSTVSVFGGVQPYGYLWNDPLKQTGKTATFLEGGVYQVNVNDGNGCTAVGTANVPEYVPLELAVLSEPDEGGPSGKAIVQVVSGTGPYEYRWQNYPTEADSILSELLPGTYMVVVTDAYDCQEFASIEVRDATQCGEVLTLITPQGDGFNEFSDNTLEIYNRWGQLVREYENYNEGDLWNGTDNRGNMVDDGVYFYVFDYLDPVANQRITKKGSVTVLRK
jgi:flagellar hook assembly protein FlgD